MRRPSVGGVPTVSSYRLPPLKTLVAVLDQVVLTGFFGTSRAAAAERLLAEAIRDLLKEGTIQKRKKAFEAQ